MILQQYHKSQNMTKKEASICRFLPQELSAYVVLYLSQVKGIETYFRKLISGGNEEELSLDAHHLFTYKGKLMEAEKIRSGFKSVMAKYGVNICLSGYRY